jgi:hypothetical protein
VKIVVEVPDLPQGLTKSHAVAEYVRAAIKVQTLRREFASALLEMRRAKATLCSRIRADTLMAEAQALCEELHIEAADQ